MKRIGILGGTFNPVHIGHLAIAQMASDKLRLDKVIFVPCNLPPHKSVKNMPSAHHRYNMVKLAIAGNDQFEISNFEIKKNGKSYSIDTLKYFRRLFGKSAKLFFIVGGDTVSQLKTWKYIADILKIATFIVVNRPGRYKKARSIKHYSVTMPGIDISSSYLRQRIAQKRAIRYFVPRKVEGYISQHRLYFR